MSLNLSVIFVFLSYCAVSQTTLKGRISDASSDVGLPGANVFIPELKLGATSDNNGRYSFAKLPAGKWTVVVSFIGYKPQTRVCNTADSKNASLIFILEPEVITTQEVTIRARVEKNVLEAIPARVCIIPVNVIETMPVQNAEGLLSAVPGINISNTQGIFSSKSSVTLRGLGGNDQSRTLVLIDDMPVNKADGGSVNWNMINKDNVERVVVLKGPGSALYGSNAMGGIINFISRKPEKKIGGRFQGGYGTYNTLYGSANLSGKLTEAKDTGLYWNLNAFGRQSDGYVTIPPQFLTEPDDSIVTRTFLKEMNLGAKVAYHFDAGNQLEVSANYFDDMRGNGLRVFDGIGANQQHDTYMWRARYNRKTGKLFLKSFIYFQIEHYQRLYEYMSEGEYKLYSADSKRRDMGFSFQVSGPAFAGMQNLTAGFDLKRGSVDAKDTYYTSTDIIYNAGQMTIGSAYVQDETNILSGKIKLVAGLRFDYAFFNNGIFNIETPSYSIEFMQAFNDTMLNPRFWTAFNPKLSFEYSPDRNLRWYFAVGQGFGAPVLDDMCRAGKRQNTFKIANPNLKPERLVNIETGADYYPAKSVSISASVYYSIGKDFMYYISTGDTVNMGYKLSPVQIRDNIGRVEIYGFDGEIRFAIAKNFEVFANYAYTHSQIKSFLTKDTLVDNNLTNKYLVDVPKNKSAFGLNWTHLTFSLGVLARYTGQRWINDTNEMEDEYLFRSSYPSVWEFGMKFRKTFFKNYELGFNIDNPFNRIFINDSGQRSPGRMVFGEFTYHF